MKTFLIRLITFFSVLIGAYSFAGNTDGYNIKISVKGLKEGSSCILAYYWGGNNVIQDSAKANAKGEVIFKGETKLAQGIYLFVPPKQKYFEFIMDAGQNFSLKTDTTDYIKYMKVKGSDENKCFYDFQIFMSTKQKELEPLREQFKKIKNSKDSTKTIQDNMNVINGEIKDYIINFIKNKPTSFIAHILKANKELEIPEAPILPNGRKDSTFAYHYYKTHFFDYFDFSDERLLRTPIFQTKINQYMESLTPQTPDSIDISIDYIIEKSRVNKEVYKYIVNWATYKYESSVIMGMDGVFVHIVEKCFVPKQVPWIDSTQLYKIINRAYTLKPLLIGKKTPDLNMPDSSGIYHELYAVKAKYTILIFWDHDCGHCKKDVPQLAELYKKIKMKGVEVYAVETDYTPDGWKKFIRENNLNWINVLEPDEYKRAVAKKIYDINSTPQIFLLDENKIIKAKRIGVEQLGNFIDMLEKENKK